MKCLILSFALLIATPFVLNASGQSKNGGSNSSNSSTSDNSGGTGNGNSNGSASNQSGNGQSGSSSSRQEIAIISYEASDEIATHIAQNVKGRRLVIYDAQAFAALQSYEAYAAIISTLETAFKLGTTQQKSTGIVPLDAAQTVVSTLASLRSSTEYGAGSVDPNLDVLTAQVINKLSTPQSVFVPKFLLLANDDLDSPAEGDIEDHDCADLDLGVPNQLACLMKVRDENRQNQNFTDTDKLFQTFLGTIIGASSTAKTPTLQAGGPDNNNPAPNNNQNNPAPNSNQNPGQANSPLALIIAGRRLKAQLIDPTKPTKLLVLEATAAGGGYRILHNFWVEVFWRTPTPAFNGGATVTYFLIDPSTSTVEKAEVLSYMYKYSKFQKMESAPNPGSWQTPSLKP